MNEDDSLTAEIGRAFGDKLREARINAGLSQRHLAKAVGSSQEAISRIENGQGPTLRKCAQLVRACGRIFRIDIV